jgi:hypothetical protein
MWPEYIIAVGHAPKLAFPRRAFYNNFTPNGQPLPHD